MSKPRSGPSRRCASAARAHGDVLVFVHVDTALPAQALDAIDAALACVDGASTRAPVGGRFDVEIAGRGRMLKVVAALMSLRSRLTGIATGDQAISSREPPSTRSAAFPNSR